MPSSSPAGKQWLRDRIGALRPASVLDIGVGAGTYAGLLRPGLPHAWFVGIEIFEPYLDLYDLTAKYNEVLIGDVREMALPAADVVIFGDVLEHVEHDQAVTVWAAGRRAARLAVFCSIPIVEYPQGPSHGNPHEEHLHTWSHEMVLADLPGIVDCEQFGEIGVYRASPA